AVTVYKIALTVRAIALTVHQFTLTISPIAMTIFRIPPFNKKKLLKSSSNLSMLRKAEQKETT
ncbi:hypothetical protein, partial [Filibacter tadaridae]|uniref:hypothetical protein n=1 Tax=Filibacter tadaridae TaxID=2483811 RepID=UPI0039EBCD2F